jgi:hypothetical protein
MGLGSARVSSGAPSHPRKRQFMRQDASSCEGTPCGGPVRQIEVGPWRTQSINIKPVQALFDENLLAELDGDDSGL